MEHGLINDIAICIVVAWLLAIAAQILRQPLILAYLIAGFAIGPVGLRLIQEDHSIKTISDLGLILLLFMIGLEIDLKKMWSAGRLIIITSLTQIFGTFALGLIAFWLAGFSLRPGALDALYLAVAASLSSTVIIVKILYEKRELDTLAGRITLGVLVLQDLFAILFLAIQPELKNPSVAMTLKSIGGVGFLVAISFFASRSILPVLFRAVARLPELVSVGALAWCFLVSGLANRLGLSREMGALVAGVAISTFPYTLDVAAKVTSLRDFFITLFFVALGLAIPPPTMNFLGTALLLAVFVVVSRFLTVVPTLYTMRQGHRASLLPALNLSQISELSLIIMALGYERGHIGRQSVGIAAYAFALLAVVSSYGMTHTQPLLLWTSGWLKKLKVPDVGDDEPAIEKRPTRIYLLGFSWTASSLLEEIMRKNPDILSELAIVDFNPVVHRELQKRGVHAIYGDISQRETLLHAGVAAAEIIVCTLSNTVLKGINNMKLLQQLREINPSAQIIVHAELLGDAAKLYAAGANYVSLPRLFEAAELLQVIDAARDNLIDQKSTESKQALEGRDEVIP